jgi:SAM-dependent methyltransferase
LVARKKGIHGKMPASFARTGEELPCAEESCNEWAMVRPDYVASYERTLASLIAQHGEAVAMDLIVGGQSDAIGILELSTLQTIGLRPEHDVIDVGCGSGRLAVKLAPMLTGKYWGSDVLPSVVAYAKKICARPEWEFHTTNGMGIPAPDACADFACFFSVFTHLAGARGHLSLPARSAPRAASRRAGGL